MCSLFFFASLLARSSRQIFSTLTSTHFMSFFEMPKTKLLFHLFFTFVICKKNIYFIYEKTVRRAPKWIIRYFAGLIFWRRNFHQMRVPKILIFICASCVTQKRRISIFKICTLIWFFMQTKQFDFLLSIHVLILHFLLCQFFTKNYLYHTLKRLKKIVTLSKHNFFWKIIKKIDFFKFLHCGGGWHSPLRSSNHRAEIKFDPPF